MCMSYDTQIHPAPPVCHNLDQSSKHNHSHYSSHLFNHQHRFHIRIKVNKVTCSLVHLSTSNLKPRLLLLFTRLHQQNHRLINTTNSVQAALLHHNSTFVPPSIPHTFFYLTLFTRSLHSSSLREFGNMHLCVCTNDLPRHALPHNTNITSLPAYGFLFCFRIQIPVPLTGMMASDHFMPTCRAWLHRSALSLLPSF